MQPQFGTFRLSIDLGNDAMRTLDDIAEALRDVADRLSASFDTEGSVRDANGNTVGKFEVTR